MEINTKVLRDKMEKLSKVKYYSHKNFYTLLYSPSLPFSCQFLQSCLPTDEGMVQIDKIEFILLKHLNIYAYSSILLVK